MRSISNSSKLDQRAHGLAEMVPMLTLLLTHGLAFFIGVCIGLYVSVLGVSL